MKRVKKLGFNLLQILEGILNLKLSIAFDSSRGIANFGGDHYHFRTIPHIPHDTSIFTGPRRR